MINYFHLESQTQNMKVTTKPQKQLQQQSQKQTPELSNWQKLVHGIVRPPRSTVRDPLATSKSFRLNETVYTRSEHTIPHNGKKLQLTVFDPEFKSGWVVLYLHGNSSSKIESYSIRQYLPFKYSLASFDFMGCGRNFEEDSISLGYREAEQAETVVSFLRERGYRIVVWGRSMGAATALRFGKASVIVADSAFKSFKSLCKQFAKAHTPCYVPNCLISCLFPCVFCKIRSDVEQQGRYDVEMLDIAEAVKGISLGTMVVFMSGDQDTLIDKRNSVKLFNLFAGQHKHLEIFKGNHNSKRPPELLRKIMEHIRVFNDRQDKQFQAGQTLDAIHPHRQP